MRIPFALSVATLAATLVGTCLVATSPVSTAAGAPVVARTANLTVRPPGLPKPGTPPARQVVAASINVDVVAERVRATVTLAGIPDAATDAGVFVGLGRSNGAGTCINDEDELVDTVSPTDGASRSGATITLDRANTFAGVTAWDCAFVAIVPPNASGTQDDAYDALIGTLTPVLGAEPVPSLAITGVEVLRKSVSKVSLVRGVATTLHVTVANAPGAAGDANQLFVSGSGKGLKVTASTPNAFPLSSGTDTTVDVVVKLTGKKGGPLTLVAHSAGGSATRTLKVATVAAPRGPVAGTYRDKKRGVSFKIRGGKVVGFNSGSQQTRCGGFPDQFTYSRAFYDAPKTKIPRNGLVDAVDRQKMFATQLQLKVVGARVSQGYFSYSGPNRCFASVEFKAKRS